MTNQDSTTNNFNIDTMLCRWEEAHNYFEKHPEIYEKIGRALIYDEYLNLALHINESYITQYHVDKMSELFNYIPEHIIKESYLLQPDEKKLMLKIRNNPSSILKSHNRINSYNTIFKFCILNIPVIEIRSKRNKKWLILLFGFIPIMKIVKR